MKALAAAALAALVLATLTAPLPAQERAVVSGTGAVLRGLDKMAGEARDLPLQVGESVNFGHLNVTLRECRYPADAPDSEAYAALTIRDARQPDPVFDGWMIASSPALSALDHARYDIWVLRCSSS